MSVAERCPLRAPLRPGGADVLMQGWVLLASACKWRGRARVCGKRAVGAHAPRPPHAPRQIKLMHAACLIAACVPLAEVSHATRAQEGPRRQTARRRHALI